tara:strand:- start:260 stop:436 length:177 start_codon:yes stop_codon:yes gene_type:complete
MGAMTAQLHVMASVSNVSHVFVSGMCYCLWIAVFGIKTPSPSGGEGVMVFPEPVRNSL